MRTKKSITMILSIILIFSMIIPASAKASSNNNDLAVSTAIQYRDEPLPFNMKSHTALTEEAEFFHKNTTSLIGAYYGKGFRYQIMDFKDKTVTIEFGNTSKKKMVLTSKNFYFEVLDTASENVSGTKLIGGSVTVAPNSHKTIKIKYTNAITHNFEIRIGKHKYHAEIIPSMDEINDCTPFIPVGSLMTPFEDPDGNLIPTTESTKELTGNGKVKYLPLGIQYTDNSKLGKIVKPKNGMLFLTKIRLANTSDKTLKINTISVCNYDSKKGAIEKEYSLTDSDMKDALGDVALPMEIEPNTIVEGYVPCFFTDSSKNVFFTLKTNMGWLEVNNADHFVPLNWQ